MITPNPALPPWPNLLPLGDIAIRQDASLGSWHGRPRPKTRRRSSIRKYQKTGRYFVPDENVYVIGGLFGVPPLIVGHPQTLAKMATAIVLANERQKDRYVSGYALPPSEFETTV